MDASQGGPEPRSSTTTPAQDVESSDNQATPRGIHVATQPGRQSLDGSSSAAAGQSVGTVNTGPLSPLSASSEAQPLQSNASDISGDRVFPIRSVVSVDPASVNPADDYFPHLSGSEGPGIPVHRPSISRPDPQRKPSRANTGPAATGFASAGGRVAVDRRKNTVSGQGPGAQLEPAHYGSIAPLLNMAPSDKDSDESGVLGEGGNQMTGVGADSASQASQGRSIDIPLVTNRFTHVVTDDGHAVITGRDGVLQRCEDEPIHTPGAIQGFGALVALHEENDGCLVARYVSENSERLLGYSPRQLFRLKNFLDILTDEQQDNLLDHIDFIRDEDADPTVNGPEVFSLSVRPPKTRSIKLWCAIHINPAHPELVICEFELDDDQEYPLRPADELTPEAPSDTMGANPTPEQIEESTEILSKPLRILRSARKRRGEQGAMQVFDIMSQVQEQLASAPTLEAFLKILVGIVKELTGFHRIMIYQFDSSFNGRVVTELVDKNQTTDLFHGLNFPASDIPRQARDLYKVNKVRLLYDRDLDTARIVCRTKDDLEVPLDMTHAYLRAMSPIHLKYLANMEVRSSMSISINAFNELWGLIACHSYGGQGMRVSFPIRKMCRLVGDTACRNIERLSYASRLQARKLINTAPTDKNPSGYIIASSDDLLRLFDADFGLLSIQGETKVLGIIDQSQEALAMLEYLRMRKLTSVVASQDVREDFPDLRYPPGFQVIAGLLYVPLSVGGSDFIVFFRKGQVKEVKWAGNPYEKTVREGTAGYLEPRSSFKTWQETVVGKCREWNEEQVETAAILCLVYGKFIEVWRQKEAAIQSSKLTRILLANSAHEVRTPLNAIINYLEIALEGSLDQETRDNLARSHSASKSLIYVINDLLDLAKAEEGQDLIKDEVFDLVGCIREATAPFQDEARRKGLDYKVIEHPGVPRFVHGDDRRVRQALSNVTANAVSHTESGWVKVETLVSEVSDRQATLQFVISDSGEGMSSPQLDALFQDLEQVSTEEINFGQAPEQDEQPAGARTLGLGLAVVARIVRNMDGQLRLKSEEGQGSRFVIQLPFQLPEETGATGKEGGDEEALGSIVSNPVAPVAASLTAPPAGEILLVDSASAMNLNIGNRSIGEENSAGSRRSGDSLRSQGSQGSDADRLINAIQTPFSLQEKEPEYPVSRHSSRGSSARPLSQRPASPQSQRQHPASPTHVREMVREPRGEAGAAEIRDSKVPVRAVKIPEEFTDVPPQPQAGEHSRVLFELPDEASQPSRTESVTSGGTGDEHNLQVLIAEDDPINLKILRKRLERTGHEVYHAADGEGCATVYREKSPEYDVILMDMQMPIVDGLTSTKMIRAWENSPDHLGHSRLATTNGRIPIFAVSASLVESEKQTYVDAGFDGWILKPIDFRRLGTLLTGIHDDETRNSCLYEPGEWERGGWFSARSVVLGDAGEEATPRPEDEDKQMR